jgi:membrane protease YdiL (CAAX protease family)
VPTGGILGTDATDFFCGAISKGSVGLIQLISNPATTLLALGALLALVLFAAWKATWRPTAPLRVGRRRSWGQIISASGRMYVGRAGLFLGIGLILIPVTALTTVLQAVFIGGLGLVGLDASGESAGALAIVVLLISATLTLFAFAFVQAATACAVQRIDEGRPVSPLSAYGSRSSSCARYSALRRSPPASGSC